MVAPVRSRTSPRPVEKRPEAPKRPEPPRARTCTPAGVSGDADPTKGSSFERGRTEPARGRNLGALSGALASGAFAANGRPLVAAGTAKVEKAGFFSNPIDFAKDKLGGAGDWVKDKLGGAGDWVKDKLGGVGDWVKDKVGGVGDWVKDKVGAVIDFAKNAAAGVVEAFSVKDRVRELNSPGDSYTLRLGGELGIKGVQGSAAAELKVEQTPEGKYTVTASGELGAGVFGVGGLRIPGVAKYGPSGEVEGQVKGSMVFEFANKEDAARAAETLARAGAANAVRLQTASPVVGALAPYAAAAIDPSKQDLDFAFSHLKNASVEYGGKAAGDITAELGLKGTLGAHAGASAELKQSVRLDIVDGKPTSVTVTQSGKVKGSADLGLELPLGKSKPGDLSAQPVASELSAQLEAKTTIPLPKDLSLGAFLSDPVGEAKRIGASALGEAQTELTLKLRAGGNLTRLAGTGELEVKATGKPSELLTADVIGAAFGGDLGGALRTAGDRVKVEAQPYSIVETGVDINPELAFGVYKAGIEVKAEVEDKTELGDRFEGSATQFVDAWASLYARAFGLA